MFVEPTLNKVFYYYYYYYYCYYIIIIIILLYGDIKFHPGMAGQVFIKICLHFLLIFHCKYLLNYFFIPLRWAEAISWENFVPAIQKRDAVLQGWNFSHVYEEFIYSTALIVLPGPGKTEKNFIAANRDHVIAT